LRAAAASRFARACFRWRLLLATRLLPLVNPVP